MRKVLLHLTGALVLSVVPLQTATATSINDALIAAYQNNPSLKAGRSDLKATDETASQAFSGWLPSANFSKERGREKGRMGIRPESSSIVDGETWHVSQPLFKGGETYSQMRRADNLFHAGYYTLQQREQDVLLAAVIAYMDVVRDEKVLTISKNNEKVLRKHLQATKERFELGEVTRTDVAQAEARLSRAISDKILAQGQLEASRATYRRVILEEPAGVTAPKTIPDIPSSLEEVLTAAETNNPTVLKSRYEAKAAKNDVNILTSRLLPSASLNYIKREEEGGINLGNSELDSESVMVNITVPLYQSGAEYSRVRQAKHTENTRRFQLDDTLNTVKENTIRAWQQLQVAVSTIQSSQDNVDAAEVALEGVRQEADVGSRTTLDVLDAEQELFIAKTDLVRAKRNQVVAVYSVLNAMGQLTAPALGLKVDVYDPHKHYKSVRFKPFGLGID